MPVDSTEPEVASRSTLADLPEHPRSNEPWFQALPEAHRERLQREWRAGLEHDAQLVRRAGTDLAREAIEHATVFGFFDLCCVGQNAGSTVAAVVVGALAGAACKQLDAAQVLSAMIGGWSFVLMQWWSRGGLSAMNLFFFLPVIAACAYLGWRRHA